MTPTSRNGGAGAAASSKASAAEIPQPPPLIPSASHLSSLSKKRARVEEDGEAAIAAALAAFEADRMELEDEQSDEEHDLTHTSTAVAPGTGLPSPPPLSSGTVLHRPPLSSSSSSSSSSFVLPRAAQNIARQIKDNSNRHQCGECEKNYSRHHALSIHIARVHKSSVLPCPVCSKLVNSVSFKAHVSSHSKIRPHSCDSCGERFRQRVELERHIRVHTGERPYKCSFEGCDAAFKQPGSLTSHAARHLPTNPFACDQCDASFKREALLVLHKRSHSDNPRPFKCPAPGCKFSARIKPHLVKHMLTHSTTVDETLRCFTCRKIYKTLQSFKVHTEANKCKPPVSCSLCQASYATQEQLDRHTATHNGKMRFTCPHCELGFSHQGNFNTHLHKHSKQIMLWCPLCPAVELRFTLLSSPASSSSSSSSLSSSSSSSSPNDVVSLTIDFCRDVPFPGFHTHYRMNKHLKLQHGVSTVEARAKLKPARELGHLSTLSLTNLPASPPSDLQSFAAPSPPPPLPTHLPSPTPPAGPPPPPSFEDVSLYNRSSKRSKLQHQPVNH